jgi:hypothetical protein
VSVEWASLVAVPLLLGLIPVILRFKKENSQQHLENSLLLMDISRKQGEMQGDITDIKTTSHSTKEKLEQHLSEHAIERAVRETKNQGSAVS